GGPRGSNALLTIRQGVYLYDIHLNEHDHVNVPTMDEFTPLLYVMDGNIKLGKDKLHKRDVVTEHKNNFPNIYDLTDSTVVLFFVDLHAEATTKELFSSIQK